MIQKPLGSRDAAERVRNFLLNLDHAPVTLGLVVVKWNAKIIGETQYFFAFVAQSPEKIILDALFDPAPFPR